LTEVETELPFGGQIRVASEIDVKLLEHIPDGHQTENWLVDPSETRVVSLKASARWAEVLAAAREPDPVLLGNRDAKKIGAAEAGVLGRSLEIIRPKDVHWTMDGFRPNGLPKFRVEFSFKGSKYDLPFTDPEIEATLRKLKEALHTGQPLRLPQPPGAVLHATVSIGEELRDGICYKILAAVFFVPWWLSPRR
jgi:hypothetical protein